MNEWMNRMGDESSQCTMNQNPLIHSSTHSLTPFHSIHFIHSFEDIQRHNISKPREQIRDRRDHHRLRDPQPQPLRIRHEDPHRARLANRRLQHFIQRRRVDRVREQAAQEHHDVHDHSGNRLRGDHQQNVLLDAALHAAVREQRQHRTQHHDERRDPDRPARASRRFGLR